METKQMLELAAKAAGYNVELDYYGEGRHGLKSADIRIPPAIWNPLEDNAGAFRLAVQLGLFFSPVLSHHMALVKFTGDVKNDCAAYRMAITKAAAEIGMQMIERETLANASLR